MNNISAVFMMTKVAMWWTYGNHRTTLAQSGIFQPCKGPPLSTPSKLYIRAAVSCLKCFSATLLIPSYWLNFMLHARETKLQHRLLNNLVCVVIGDSLKGKISPPYALSLSMTCAIQNTRLSSQHGSTVYLHSQSYLLTCSRHEYKAMLFSEQKLQFCIQSL